MPVQHTLFGLTLPSTRRMPPRRITIVLGIVLFFAASTILFTIPSLLPTVPSSVARLSDSAKDAAQYIHKPKLSKLTVPSIHIPFRQTGHEPPVQKNSTSGEAKWFSDWKWLNPFSSSITLDENRSVLPPLRQRPPVYTFYEPSTKDEATRAAENRLLLTWRRAWWAQGFTPVVLGRAEAMNNPLYEGLQSKGLNKTLETEVVRWLAWGHMGTGILANWLAVPMGPYEDHLLSYLRRGDYPTLSRYKHLGSGLFSGDSIAINAAVKEGLQNSELNNLKSFIDAIPTNTFKEDPQPKSVAFYDSSAINIHYKTLAKKFDESKSAGLNALQQLINSHLHTTFQNTFKNGIAVLKPLPAHTTALVEPALQIATLLAQCPETPIPSSCPPNLPSCTPCDTAHPIPITIPQVFRNTSTLYTIGTIPHPYTLASLIAQRDTLETRYIRRETPRDRWLQAATEELLGPDIGGPTRVVRFKEAVAGDFGGAHGLWFTAEKDIAQKEMDWHFGFALPRNATTTTVGEGHVPVPGSGDPSRPPLEPSPKELEMEKYVLVKAREALKSRERPRIGIREVVEAWNLADTEAWRFVRAYRARAKVERLKWEEKERGFAGAERVRGSAWGRWFDRE